MHSRFKLPALDRITIGVALLAMVLVWFLSIRDVREGTSQSLFVLGELSEALVRAAERDKARMLDDQRQLSGLRSLRETLNALRAEFAAGRLDREHGLREAAAMAGDAPAVATMEPDASRNLSEIDVLASMAFREGLEKKDVERETLPKGLRPRRLISEIDLDSILAHPELNPEHRVPTFAESTKAVSVLRQAKAMVEILDSEILLEMAEGGSKMRSEGAYVTYARGERYATEPGMLTFADQDENSNIRLYYFHEDEYPELYGKKRMKDTIAERALAQVVDIVRGDGSR